MTQNIFVCGTDTGIGKTIVTGSLLAFFKEKGLNVSPFKPFESGCSRSKTKGMKRHLNRSDTEFLLKMSGANLKPDDINVYAYEEALAPGVAAQRLGSAPKLSAIKKAAKTLEKKSDLVLAEGAGGLLVPLVGKKTTLDLIKMLDWPVLLIARLGLGTLNHTLLTLDHLKRHGIKVLGVILNENVKQSSLAEKTNADVLKEYGVKILGTYPYLKNKSKKQMIAQVEKHIEWKKLT